MTQENTLDLDLLPDVPETSTSFKQRGKLKIATKLLVWRVVKDEQGRPVKDDSGRDKRVIEETSRADWQKTEKKDRAMDMLFTVNLREFKPQLSFDYERKVRVGGPDWNQIVAPSIEKIFGKGSMADEKGKREVTLLSLIDKYVEVEDAPQVPKKNASPDAKVYNTIKFNKVYASREACLSDVSEGFAGTASANGAGSGFGESVSDPNVPTDYSKEDWLSMKGDVVNAVSAAVSAAEVKTKGKPKPVVAKAIADAKQAAIAGQAKALAATPAQVEWLLAQ